MKYLLFLTISIINMPIENSDETSTLYQQSLYAHLSTLDIDTVFILKCFDIKLPSRVKHYHIIDISENPKIFLKTKSDLYAIKILPIEIDKGNIKIGLIDYILREDEGEIMMGYASSESFIYKYNSKSKQYKLIKREKHTF
jgi:hypothetical protein